MPASSIAGYQATAGTQAERAALDALPGHPLARHIDDFLTDLANANKPRNTIRAYGRPDRLRRPPRQRDRQADRGAGPGVPREILGQAP